MSKVQQRLAVHVGERLLESYGLDTRRYRIEFG